MSTLRVIRKSAFVYVLIASALICLILNGCADSAKNEISFGETTLYFTKNVPRDEAQSLGDYLYEIG